jgi:uncharacterized protein
MLERNKMKNYLKALIIIILTLFSCKALAFTAPPPPPNGTFVLDFANKLSPQQLSTLNSKIEGIKTSSKNEFGVLILQSMGGESIEDVAYTTFNSWGVGHRGLDNGVLIVIAAAERKTRIETGKGVGELTDLQCNDILKNTLRPFLKSGDYFGGLNATIDAASSAVDSRKNTVIPTVSNTNAPTESDNFGLTILLSFVVLLFAGVIGYFIVMFFVNKNEEEKERSEKAYEDHLDWERQMKNTVPEIPKPLVKREYKTSTAIAIGAGAAAAVGGVAIAVSLEEADKKRRRDQERRDEEDRARRRREEDDRSSSYSSSSSSSDSGSSWGGGSDSGSSFDGGSSGGGGSGGSF